MENTNLDPVAVLTLLVGFLVGPKLAEVVGPYVVILMAASVGATWGLSRESTHRTVLSAVSFYMRVNVMAVLLTVGLAQALEHWVVHQPVRWLLVPVAMGIGWVGDAWPHIFSWTANKLRNRAARALGGKGE